VKLRKYIKVKSQTAPFPTPTNTDATLGGGTESAETVQHDSFIALIKQQEENRGINSTTKCTRMFKITKKTFKPWELSNLLIPQF
jgi:hypothetical protein